MKRERAVIEDLTFNPHIDKVVIVGGDSDYIAIAQKVRKMGKEIIGIGIQETSNQYWIKSCNQFKFYRSLLPKTTQERSEIESGEVEQDDLEDARALLVRAINRLMSTSGSDSVLKASIRPMMQRLDPSFDVVNLGFGSFQEFLNKCDDVIKVDKGGSDHIISFKKTSSRNALASATESDDPVQFYVDALSKQLFRLPVPSLFISGLTESYHIFSSNREGLDSFAPLREALKVKFKSNGLNSSEQDIKRIQDLLFKSFVCNFGREPYRITLHSSITSPQELITLVCRQVIRKLSRVIQTIDPEIASKALTGTSELRDTLAGIIEEMS